MLTEFCLLTHSQILRVDATWLVILYNPFNGKKLKIKFQNFSFMYIFFKKRMSNIPSSTRCPPGQHFHVRLQRWLYQ